MIIIKTTTQPYYLNKVRLTRHRLKGDILFNANLDATQVLATCRASEKNPIVKILVRWDPHPISRVEHKKIKHWCLGGNGGCWDDS